MVFGRCFVILPPRESRNRKVSKLQWVLAPDTLEHIRVYEYQELDLLVGCISSGSHSGDGKLFVSLVGNVFMSIESVHESLSGGRTERNKIDHADGVLRIFTVFSMY